jgi:hypothetical protein
MVESVLDESAMDTNTFLNSPILFAIIVQGYIRFLKQLDSDSLF